MLRRGIVLGAFVLLTTGLVAQNDDFGSWETLFNGKDTTGWKNAKVEPALPCQWKVEDGALTNGKDGGVDACTTKSFDNYELELEYKLPARRTPDFRGNSGVYLRGQIEVQIYDTYGVKDAELGGIHAGAIYSGPAPKLNPQNPPGEWNKYRIRHIGNRITVWHNDKLAQDNFFLDKPTPGSMPSQTDISKGPIMFQGDHTQVWYRNVRIRPIASGEGWKPLWNGKDLTQFTTRDPAKKVEAFWNIKAHAIRDFKDGDEHASGHDLWTAESYGNYLLHYEYRTETVADGNSGFYLRDQWEIQILRDQRTDESHTNGSLYDMYPPLVKARNDDPNAWNQMDVKVDGMKIWIWQNGKLIHDGRVCERRTDNAGVKTTQWTKNQFKLQGDHGQVWFTNLFIKPLPDTK